MGKIKAFIIILGVIAIAALVGLGFWVGPSLIGPWTEVILANRTTVALIVLLPLTISIALSSWKWWAKAIAFLLCLSLSSSISGKPLTEMMSDIWYIRMFGLFAITVFVTTFVKAIKKKTINLSNLNNCIDFSSIVKMRQSAITLKNEGWFFQFGKGNSAILKKNGKEMQLCFTWPIILDCSYYTVKESIINTNLGKLVIPDNAEIRTTKWGRSNGTKAMDITISWTI